MEQFATALGQAAFVDGLDERGRRKGRIPVSRHDLFVSHWELVPTRCTRVPSQPFHTVTYTMSSRDVHFFLGPPSVRPSCTSRSH
jgi:hypothetical protein